MKCPRCQQENPSQARFCMACGARLRARAKSGKAAAGGNVLVNRRKAPKNDSSQVHDLEKRLAEALEQLQTRNRELGESQEQQTATAGILRIISSSPADVQPVLEAVAENAARLCESFDSSIFRRDGDRLLLVAHHGPIPFGLVGEFAIPLTQGSLVGRSIIEHRAVQVTDLQTETEEFPLGAATACQFGYRTSLAVPLLRESAEIGAISIRRTEVRPFTERQVALLQIFADQAVIAIENVRLFTETKEALEQQTATAEILRVISSSPTDVQPVFDAIARRVVALCDGRNAIVLRFDGEMLHLASHHGVSPEGLERNQRAFPRRPWRDSPTGRAFLDRSVVHVPDRQAATEFVASTAQGAGSLLAVPLLREQEAIGVIGVTRNLVGPFSSQQVELLKTFADQAVIAIENVRLFKELQTSNQDLTTALDKQTATSDILRVISQSQTDAQPVFDAIVTSAVRLLRGSSGGLTRVVGDQIALVALMSTDDAGDAALRAFYPRPLQSAPGMHILVIRDRAPLNVADAHTDPRLSEAAQTIARARGIRSQVAVPLLRRDEAIGALTVNRREPGGFTDDEIALLKTFADQAVIAIENVRLFTELQARTQQLTRSVDQLTALGEVGRAVSSTLDLETVLTTIVSRAVELSGLDGGIVSEYEEATEEFVQRAASQTGNVLANALRGIRYRKGEGAIGRTALTRQPVQVPDITVPGAYDSRVRAGLIESGVRAVLAVPMIHQDRLVGCLGVTRNRPGDFPAETIDLLRTFATQSALAIQNARLFREIEDKSRQLEVASQHKSEFLANMSHELRTPLNAIIGFSEVLSDRMFGDLNEKQEEYLKDIYASGTHLLSLINDILDLSKIEAGRMELELTDFHLPTALDSALTLVRERAGRRSIALHLSVDERLGHIQADERKVRQVVLNLLSNAIKFTPEGGRIEVAAVPKDGFVEVSVSDTGVGIAPEDQEAVFEEFRQVGTADKKVEGTGLGLTLCRKFVELHGGRIWVKSQVGVGSTFTFTLLMHRGE
jgi:signal transduction histidine kinase/putative methionine-R-sulfoxide reductase with GAF domain